MPVTVLFLPELITVNAQPGEPLLNVAERAGVSIRTGCLRGVCNMCIVQIEGQEGPVRACMANVPTNELSIVHHQVAANN
jgi:ferredoxin